MSGDTAPDTPIASGFMVVEISRHGKTARFAVLDEHEYIQSHHAKGRFYEEDLLDVLREILKPGDIVLDVGANIGNHTIFFTGICGCRAVAVEPDPDNFAHLSRNVSLNDLEKRVSLVHAAAGESSGGFVEVASRTPGNSGAVSFTPTQADTGIPSVRLDDLEMPGSPKLVKIDTEGMDLAVLRGAGRLLADHRPIIVVEAATIEAYDAIAGYLKQFDYVCLDARNPTPTFIFSHHVVPSESVDLVETLATTFAHQRIGWSIEVTRLNELVRHARQVYERSKSQVQELSQRLKARGEEVAALGADLASAVAESRRATNAYRAAVVELNKVRSSASFQVGHAIVRAIARPGKNTVLLPWSLLAIALRRRKKRAELTTVGPDPTAPASAPTVRAPELSAVAWGERKATRAEVPQCTFDVPAVTDLRELRVACIMDEFTYNSYSPECRLLQLTPDKWESEIAGFEPHLLFVESAWRGADGLWNRCISNVCQELIDLVAWCRERRIPTVFWNKEDPVHFRTFISAAKLFDHVFTTDIDCISRYRTVLDAQQVHLLPFACQPSLHNPVETFERKDAFCFAGAYYTRYPERIKDLETFVATLTGLGQLDIFDRNYHEDDPNYMFPEKYKPLIVGHLPPAEIDRAYKGYRYGVNLNSIKYSQTMFARRVYELLASNTVTVSNYSRGLRLLFGDLVISTDNGTRLREQLSQLSKDELRFRKLRLAGLRKVLAEHTYRDRLACIAETVFGMPRRTTLPHITAVSLAADDAELAAAFRSFGRQQYPDKSLVVLLREGYQPSTQPAGEDVRVLTWSAALSQRLGDVVTSGFVAGFVAGDYYGPCYLQDLALTTRYSSATAIGKRSSYRHTGGVYEKQVPGSEYHIVDALPLRCAAVKSDHLADRSFAELLSDLPGGEVSAEECLSIDEFNYCQDYAGDTCTVVDDLDLADTGLTLAELEAAVDSIVPDEDALALRHLPGKELLRLLGRGEADGVELRTTGDGLHINANLMSHEYLYAKEVVRPADLGFEAEAKVYFEITPGLDVRFVLRFLDARRRRLESAVLIGNRNQLAPLPKGTAWVQMGLRVAGIGSCTVNGVVLGHVQTGAGALLGRSDVLVLANQYPSYDDLYRYGFLHRRVIEYRKSGQLVDVFRFNATQSGGYSEFNGIDVMTGYEDELHQVLRSGRHRTVLVHLLEPGMWEVLRHYLDQIRVIVWVHGAEVQPWHRREFNITTEEERGRAIEVSDKRMAFWRAIFGDLHPNLHFVFVSQYLADEVTEDVGLPLPPGSYSIIHNVIDTDLFPYQPKDPEQRKKVLSIRSFASRKYANDLTAQAILELSTEPFFSDMHFRLIGDGRLFEETVEPLRAFPNVILERGFIRQEEIAALQREYGVFLTPSRWDSQGVSRDEAMAAGLVPITNRISGVPEFVDENSGLLVAPEDSHGLAEAMARIYRDPDLFLRLSRGAAERVRKQSGREQTIAKELMLLRAAGEIAANDQKPQPMPGRTTGRT